LLSFGHELVMTEKPCLISRQIRQGDHSAGLPVGSHQSSCGCPVPPAGFGCKQVLTCTVTARRESPHQQGRDTKMAQRSFCGIDVAKDRLDVMVLPEELCWSVVHDKGGWAKVVARLRGLRIAATRLSNISAVSRGRRDHDHLRCSVPHTVALAGTDPISAAARSHGDERLTRSHSYLPPGNAPAVCAASLRPHTASSSRGRGRPFRVKARCCSQSSARHAP
jgi:hypothetical protein